MSVDLRLPALLTPGRLRRFGGAVAVALVLAFVVFIVTADGVSAVAGGRVGGDWAAFHTAGVLLLDDPAALLDASAQREAMAPWLDGNFAPFPYPPLFGYAYVPFALLPFTAGYVAYVLVLVLVAVAAIRGLLDLADVAPEWRSVGLLGGLTFAGTFISIGGAQNTVVTLLLLVATMRLVDDDRPVLAGAVLSLLWFKPQYAIPVLLLLLVAGHWRTAATALAGGVGIAALTTVVFGPDWPARWLALLTLTDAGNRLFNTSNTVSAVEWLRGVLAAPWGDVVGLALAGVLGLGCAAVARAHPHPLRLLPLLGLAVLLTAPHALTYELALLVPALAVVAGRHGIPWALLAWLVAPLVVAGVPPGLRIAYVAVVAVGWWWAVRDDHTAAGAAANHARAAARRPTGQHEGTT